jgi:hypothetical protein
MVDGNCVKGLSARGVITVATLVAEKSSKHTVKFYPGVEWLVQYERFAPKAVT